jgi:putative flippase GtrA
MAALRAGGAERRRVARYGVVGVGNTVLDFALYALLISLGAGYIVAKTLALLVTTLNGYTVNRLWTFEAGPHQHAMLARYVGVQGLCLAANIGLLALLIEGFGLGKIVAQAVVVPVIAASSFIGNRLWTFASSTT